MTNIRDFKKEFENEVPYDPGYSKISFSFIENIDYILTGYNELKVLHQKKFRLSQLEPTILELITKSTSFYLGCLLWGGFTHYRFKNDPKVYSGNNIVKLSEEAKKELDCATETKFTLEYIKLFDRDCKYLLKRSAKVPPFIIEILETYNEFAEINNNFINVVSTADIKIPKALEHFKNLSENQLDELCAKIYAAIESKKIENLLEIGFYKRP